MLAYQLMRRFAATDDTVTKNLYIRHVIHYSESNQKAYKTLYIVCSVQNGCLVWMILAEIMFLLKLIRASIKALYLKLATLPFLGHEIVFWWWSGKFACSRNTRALFKRYFLISGTVTP